MRPSYLRPASIWSPVVGTNGIAVEGRAARRLERRGRLDVRREAVVEQVGGADAVGELLVALAGAVRRVAVDPVVTAIQRDDETPDLDLVLEVDADLLAGLVDEREDRRRAGMSARCTPGRTGRSTAPCQAEAELRETVVMAVVHAEEQRLLDAAAGIDVEIGARIDGQRVDPLVEREDRSG